MSKFIDEARALIDRIFHGSAEDEATKADVEELRIALEANMKADSENANTIEDVKTIMLEVLNKLAEAQPPQS